MSIVNNLIQADPDQNDVAPTLVVSGLDITLPAGTYKIAGADRLVALDQTYTVTTDPTYDHSVKGFIVREIGTGDIVLLVDDVADDGLDAPCDLSSSETYELLWRLFHVAVPAGTVDLAGLSLEVQQTTPRPTPPSERS